MTDKPTTDQKATEVARRRALVKASPALQPYGTFEEVQELIRRFKVMLPETAKMTDDEVVALAQVSYIHGLNPLPAVREIIWIPGIGPMVGIRGLRRKGREWAESNDLGMPDLHLDLLTDAVEREKYEIPQGALAFKCIGGFPTARAKWVQDAKTLREALGPDAPYQVILESIGPMPMTTGWGYVTAEEMERKDTPKWWHKCSAKNGKATPLFGMDDCPECGQKSFAQPTAYSHAQQAMKRAEAHWWKQAADLPFAVTPGGEGVADMDGVPVSIEGTWKDVTPETLAGMPAEEVEKYVGLVQEGEERTARNAAKTPDQIKAEGKAASEALFGPSDKPSQPDILSDPAPRDWPGEFVEHARGLLVEAKVMPPDSVSKHLIMLLNLSPFGPLVKDEDLVAWTKMYRGHRDAGMKTKDAAKTATAGFAAGVAPF
jgi:hypothetical protein